MPRIPLEDDFTDVLRKAQRGLGLTNRELAARAGVTPANLTAIQEGRPLDAVLRRVARHLRLSPDALESLAHRRWYPVQPDFPRGFFMTNTPYRDMGVNSYLIWDPASRRAAVFDTGSSCEQVLTEIEVAGLRLEYIFLTHAHRDHIADLKRLVAATEAEVWISDQEPSPPEPARTFSENAHFHLGTLAIKTLLTPGHCPGQTTYYVTGLSWPLAIVGDSLFAASIGSSPTGFAEQLENDRKKILTLPRDTVIAPGHGPLTSVAQELRHNPFFAR